MITPYYALHLTPKRRENPGASMLFTAATGLQITGPALTLSQRIDKNLIAANGAMTHRAYIKRASGMVFLHSGIKA